MNITRIILKNMGPHILTDISFDQPLTGIIGSNGAGKTFLIESVPAVFFGSWPSRGNITDGITDGYFGDAYLAVYFDYKGLSYVAERKIRKTAKTTTHEAMLTCDGKAIAGPKVSDFENTILAMFPKDIFFSSAFSAQNGSGDFINCSATERKSIMVESLGLHRFQEKSDKFKALAKAVSDKLSTFETSKAQLESCIKEEIAVEPYNHLEEELKVKQEEQTKLIIEATVQEEKKKQLADIQLKGQTLAKKKADAENRIETLSELSKKTAELKKQIDEREDAIAFNAQITEYNRERQTILDKNNAVRNLWITHKNEIIARNNERNVARLKLESDNRAYLTNKQMIMNRAAILESGNFTGDNCKTCQFLSDAILAKKALETIAPFPNIVIVQDEELPVEPKYEAVPDAVNPKPVGVSVQELYNQSLSANNEIATLKEQCVSLDVEISDLRVQYNTIHLSLQDESIRVKINDITTELSDLSSKINEIKATHAKQKQIQEGNNEIIQKIHQLESNNAKDMVRLRSFQYLQQAYGKSGIQALIMDSALPSIERLANDMLHTATDGGISIAISTQKELKSGALSESLEIMASDAEGQREVSSMSGGEQKLIRAIFRLAFSTFNSEQGTAKIRTLIFDEIFENVDSERAEQLLKVIRSMSERFDKIILISHSDEIDLENTIRLEKRGGKTHVS